MLDVSGLAALVARGGRARCKRVVGGLARVGADCAHRAAAAPSPTRTPPGPPGSAPASSAASGRWGVVPGRIHTNPCPHGNRSPPISPWYSPTNQSSWGGGPAYIPLPHAGWGGGAHTAPPPSPGFQPQSVLVLEFLQGPFLRGDRCWCVRGVHPVRKPVCRELGLVLAQS